MQGDGIVNKGMLAEYLDACAMVEEAEANGATWDWVGNVAILKDKDGKEVKC